VSIPRHHIPTDHWEFEYGPAENDPEFGNVDDDMDADASTDPKADDAGIAGVTDQRGRWVHKVTGNLLGGKDRWLEFTVVGLTVANQMLSLVGSVQPDPFSPEHVPQSKQDREQQQRSWPSQRPVSEPIASEVTDDEELDAFAAAQPPSPADDDGGGQRRKEKEKKKKKGETSSSRGKGREGEVKMKRNRKEDRDVPKSEHKPKRKKTS